MRFSQVVKPTVRFGAVFRCREPYGPVRYVLQSGSVRFSDIVQKYDAMPCGCGERKHRAVRCVAVNRNEPHKTERKNSTVLRTMKLLARQYIGGVGKWV